MTVKEQCYTLIEAIPEKKLSSVVRFFNDVLQIQESSLEEILDDMYCVALAERYDRLAEQDGQDERRVSIEEYAKKWNIKLDVNADYDDRA